MANTRIPLAINIEARDNLQSEKDGLLVNAFVDKGSSGNFYATKRPGFYVGSEAITTGLNRGIFYNPYDDNTYYVNDTGVVSTLGVLAPVAPWNQFEEYESGDKVTQNGNTYTALQSSKGLSPKDNPLYWFTPIAPTNYWSSYTSGITFSPAPRINVPEVGFIYEFGTSLYSLSWNQNTNLNYSSQGDISSTSPAWTNITAPTSIKNPSNIASFDDIVVAKFQGTGFIGDPNTVYTIDGTTWNSVYIASSPYNSLGTPIGATGSTYNAAVAMKNNNCLKLGSTYYAIGPNYSNLFVSSSDALNWSPVSAPSGLPATSVNINRVYLTKYGTEAVLLLFNESTVDPTKTSDFYTSTDMVNWTFRISLHLGVTNAISSGDRMITFRDFSGKLFVCNGYTQTSGYFSASNLGSYTTTPGTNAGYLLTDKGGILYSFSPSPINSLFSYINSPNTIDVAKYHP